jgi:hypothetical protein
LIEPTQALHIYIQLKNSFLPLLGAIQSKIWYNLVRGGKNHFLDWMYI